MRILAQNTDETRDLLIEYTPPLTLGHKPIFMVPYAPFDGWYGEHQFSDAQYISIGEAQWREKDGDYDLSLKVWRKGDKRWSRQSEELPLHRAVDLCILLVEAIYQPNNKINDDIVLLRKGTFSNQAEDLLLSKLGEIPPAFTEEGDADDPSVDDRTKARLRLLRDKLNAAQLD